MALAGCGNGDRIAKLEKSIATLRADAATDVGALRSRIDELKSKIDAIESTSSAAKDAADTANSAVSGPLGAESKIDDLERDIRRVRDEVDSIRLKVGY